MIRSFGSQNIKRFKFSFSFSSITKHKNYKNLNSIKQIEREGGNKKLDIIGSSDK